MSMSALQWVRSFGLRISSAGVKGLVVFALVLAGVLLSFGWLQPSSTPSVSSVGFHSHSDVSDTPARSRPRFSVSSDNELVSATSWDASEATPPDGDATATNYQHPRHRYRARPRHVFEEDLGRDAPIPPPAADEQPPSVGGASDATRVAYSLLMSLSTREALTLQREASSSSSSVRVKQLRQSCDGPWRLPRGKTRFCRASDGPSLLQRSRLTRMDLPRDNVSLLCDAQSPMSLMAAGRGVSNTTGGSGRRYTTPACTYETCGTLQPACILSVPSAHCPLPAIVLPFRQASLVRDGTTAYASFASTVLPLPGREGGSSAHNGDESQMYRNYPTPRRGVSHAPLAFAGFPAETLQRCADFAMRSFCNFAFQLQHPSKECANGGSGSGCLDPRNMVKCVAFQIPHRRTGRAVPQAHLPLFHFMQRAEWRPSLLRDDLRVVITLAPERVFFVNHDGFDAPTIKFGLKGPFGDVVPTGIRAAFRVKMLITRCPATLPAAITHRLATPHLIGERRVSLAYPESDPSEVWNLGRDADVELWWGWLNLSMWVGCSCAIDIRADVFDASPTTPSFQPSQQHQERIAVLRRRVASVILIDTEGVSLQLMETERKWKHAGPSDEATPSPLVAPSTSAPCAAHLRSDECCLEGIVARHVTPLGSHLASSRRWADGRLLRLTEKEPHRCLQIVDGFVSSFEYHGEAVFPRLVLRNRCRASASASASASRFVANGSAAASDNTIDAVMTPLVMDLYAGDKDLLATLHVPLDATTAIVNACGGLQQWFNTTGQQVSTTTSPQVTSVTAHHQDAPRGNESRGVMDGDGQAANASSSPSKPTILVSPILFSICVHESVAAVRRQLENIHHMVPSSVVVLHVSAQWNVHVEELRSLNGTAHPMVFINSLRHEDSLLKLVFLQLYNAKYMADTHPQVQWSHVVLMASNEAVVKAGIAAYISPFDMAAGGRPALGPTMAVRHSFFGGRPDVKFIDTENLDHAFDYWWGNGHAGGLRGDFGFMRLMRILGLRKLSTHQRYTEGSYFRRDIAVLLAQLIETFFEAPGDCLDTWTSRSEAYLYQILQRACTVEQNQVEGKYHRGGRPPSEQETYARYMEWLGTVRDDEAPPNFDRNATAQLMTLVEHATCGEKSGTMAWQSDGWRVSVDEVRAARCSPFSVPFTLKRVDRNPDHDVWKHLAAIEADPVAVTQLRETAPAYCGDPPIKGWIPKP